MKTILSPLMLLALTSTTFASVNHKKFAKEWNQVVAMEKASQTKSAALKSALLVQEIAKNAKLDEMVASIDRTFVTKKKEVVTESDNFNFGFKILFGLIGGSAHSGWSTSEILTTNPQDVASYSAIKASDFSNLQKRLDSYIKNNETEIFYTKAFAIKALELTTKLKVSDASGIYPVVMKSAQQASNITFIGYQKVIECDQVDYAEVSNGWGIKLTGILKLNIGETETRQAHSVMTCSNGALEHSVTERALNSVDLMLADDLLRDANQTLQLKMLKEVEAEVYPSWGSPYLQ